MVWLSTLVFGIFALQALPTVLAIITRLPVDNFQLFRHNTTGSKSLALLAHDNSTKFQSLVDDWGADFSTFETPAGTKMACAAACYRRELESGRLAECFAYTYCENKTAFVVPGRSKGLCIGLTVNNFMAGPSESLWANLSTTVDQNCTTYVRRTPYPPPVTVAPSIVSSDWANVTTSQTSFRVTKRIPVRWANASRTCLNASSNNGWVFANFTSDSEDTTVQLCRAFHTAGLTKDDSYWIAGYPDAYYNPPAKDEKPYFRLRKGDDCEDSELRDDGKDTDLKKLICVVSTP